MKIALLIERFDPAAGGNERSTAQIAERLQQRGHEVTIITFGAPRENILPGVTIRCVGRGKPKRVDQLLQFIRFAGIELKRGRFDVSLAVTNVVRADVMQPRGGTVRETLDRNIAMRPAGSRRWKRLMVALNPKQRLLLDAERRNLRGPRVRRIIAISSYVQRQLREHYDIDEQRITVIPNAASVQAFDAEQREHHRCEVRQVFSIEPDETVFLFAAMNPGLKGIDGLIEAADRLRRAGQDFRVIAAGEAPIERVRRTHRLGLAEHFIWTGPTRQIDRLYAAADVTVLPSGYDPASKVVIESLLHGIPAISTRYNGASDWIENPRGDGTGDGQPAGRVISGPSAVDELVRAMQTMLDPTERARCAAAAEGLDQRLSMDRHVDQLEQVLKDVAQAKASV